MKVGHLTKMLRVGIQRKSRPQIIITIITAHFNCPWIDWKKMLTPIRTKREMFLAETRM